MAVAVARCAVRAARLGGEMVPGQHHVRMHMYIAQARNGEFKVIENLGVIDPKDAQVGALATA